MTLEARQIVTGHARVGTGDAERGLQADGRRHDSWTQVGFL
jgi:hypothetical protein